MFGQNKPNLRCACGPNQVNPMVTNKLSPLGTGVTPTTPVSPMGMGPMPTQVSPMGMGPMPTQVSPMGMGPMPTQVSWAWDQCLLKFHLMEGLLDLFQLKLLLLYMNQHLLIQ
ncbi:MAG: hypothetical protein K0S51_1315 [Bacillales bacterium]|nr:hypothetical protein [Bacillales bacterium]